MNGFVMMADSYKKLAAEGKISQEEAAEEIRIYDFLATCSKEDIFRLVDSGAFNDIIRAYAKRAIDNGGIGGLFDLNADEVINANLH